MKKGEFDYNIRFDLFVHDFFYHFIFWEVQAGADHFDAGSSGRLSVRQDGEIISFDAGTV